MTTTLTITSGQASFTAQGYTILPSPGTAVPDNLAQTILAAAYTAGVVLSSSAGTGTVIVPSRRFTTSGTGAPSSGSWLLGDELVDANGVEWECTAAGSPGTWVAAQSGTFAAKGTRRAVAQVAGNQVDSVTSVSDMVVRYPLRVPLAPGQVTTRWRYCTHTSQSATNTLNPVSITVTGVALGLHSYDSNGQPTGNFTAAPATALTSFTTPSDGSVYRSAWITDPTLQLTAGLEHLLSMGWTGTPGNTVVRTSARAFWRSNAGESAKWATQTLTLNSATNGWHESWIEYEVAGLSSLAFVVGDSLTSGYLGEMGCQGAWPELAALANGFLVVNAGITGALATDWTTGTTLRWTKWGLGSGIAPDFGIVAIGTNDVNHGDSAATIQANIVTVMNTLRSVAGVSRVYIATLPPRSLTATPEGIRVAVNAWARQCPNGAAGCFDFDKATQNPSSVAALDSEWAQPDLVHMHAGGYKRLADAVRVPSRIV